MHYYQIYNGRISAACDVAQSGFEYSEDEIIRDYAGCLVFKKDSETEEYAAAKAAYEKEQYKKELRRRRENECFAIVDRAAWFYGLSDERKAEVLAWREAWLNVTDTLMVPEKPNWI